MTIDLSAFDSNYLFWIGFQSSVGGRWHQLTVQHCLSAEQGAAILQPFLSLKGVELISNELKAGIWVAQVQIAPTWQPEDNGLYLGIKNTLLAKIGESSIDISRVRLEGFI